MLAELRLQDRRQQLRPRTAARDRMKRCGRLADRLAAPADKPLAHRLDHLPRARHDFERLGHVLAKLRERPLAAGASGGSGDHHPLARQVRGQRPSSRSAVRRDRGIRIASGQGGAILARCSLELLELQLQLIELAATLGRRPEPLLAQLGDQQLEVRDERLGAGRAGLRLLPRGALRQKRRTQRLKIVWERGGGLRHVAIQARDVAALQRKSSSRQV